MKKTILLLASAGLISTNLLSQVDLVVENGSQTYNSSTHEITINFDVKNTGTVDIGFNSGARVGFYLSADTQFDADGTDYFIVYAGLSYGVMAGSCFCNQSLSYNLDNVGAPSGNYNVLIVADDLEKVTETNETNNLINASTVSYTTSATQTDADLYPQIVGSVNFDETTSIVSFELYIQSGTTSDLPNSFTLAYYISTDNILDGNDNLLSTLEITPSMMALGGGYYPTSGNFKLSVPGNWYILIVADVDNSIQETNENNNIISTTMISVGAVSIEYLNASTYNTLKLSNYPNPVHSVSNVKINIPQNGHTSLSVMDITGKEIKQLINEEMLAGEHIVPFDASHLPSGTYFYTLTIGNTIETNKFIKYKYN